MNLTFDSIRKNGLLLYEYVRGSHLYGLNTETSDMDYGGVFICPQETLFGLRSDYTPEVSDSKHDTCWWELGRFIELALTSNPTALEALFVPDDKVIYIHPLFQEIKNQAKQFITKACFKPFFGYASSQISKCRGQNKMIHMDMENVSRIDVLDFCHTLKENVSIPIKEWLSANGLLQKYCGLSKIDHMNGFYALHYDFGSHFRYENISRYDFSQMFFMDNKFQMIGKYIGKNILSSISINDFYDDQLNNHSNKGYSGICEDDLSSNDVRCSSIEKKDPILCYLYFNKNGYEEHCRKWKSYREWKLKRNPNRYKSNLEGKNLNDPDKFYDCKHLMHCFRLIKMCIEIANGEGVKLDRTNIDKDFLLDIRNRKYGYTELMDMVLKLRNEMNDAIDHSQLPDQIDKQIINKLLIDIRTKFYGH